MLKFNVIRFCFNRIKELFIKNEKPIKEIIVKIMMYIIVIVVTCFIPFCFMYAASRNIIISIISSLIVLGTVVYHIKSYSS